MMEALNIPPNHVLEESTRKKLFFTEENEPIYPEESRQKIKTPGSKKLRNMVKTRDELFLDLIKVSEISNKKKCLNWDPEDRITPEEALHHEWILEGLPPTTGIKKLAKSSSNEVL
jgi:dual specificity tyrosine-phosphorylation-regulated kinase 2/3/4